MELIHGLLCSFTIHQLNSPDNITLIVKNFTILIRNLPDTLFQVRILGEFANSVPFLIQDITLFVDFFTIENGNVWLEVFHCFLHRFLHCVWHLILRLL